ncbi:MAG: hypothetical protein WCS94_02925 [Verrucomicrobiota bacterium]
MNESPEKPSGVRILRWILLIIGAVALFFAGSKFIFHFRPFIPQKGFYVCCNLIAIGFLIWMLMPILRRLVALERRFFRWFLTWRILRRVLVSVGILALLLPLFYAEENWRGQRAWENCKRELEAKGVVLDWNKFIPPPVPDDQNFFKAPKMMEWFVRSTNTISSPNTNGLSQRLSNAYTTNNPVVLAEWTWQRLLTAKNIAAADSENADLVLKYSSTPSHLHTFVEANVPPVVDETPRTPQSYASPDLNRRISRLLQNVVGTNIIIGLRGEWLLAKSHAEIKPARIILLSGMKPDPEIVAWFTQCFPTNATGGGSPRIHVEPPIGTIPFPNTFRVILDSAYSVADFLAWSDQFAPDFDLVREALKRPYARMDGDYSKPHEQPIPNFVTVRMVAQTLAQRAKCELLLGQPDKALQDLTLMHDMCRLLEAAPTGKPMTLVSAMINVAVTGLYVYTLANGLESHAWKESQLVVLQKQLAEINLAPFMIGAFACEPAGSVSWLEHNKPSELFNLSAIVTRSNRPETLWDKIRSLKGRWWDFVPHGWICQNIVHYRKITDDIHASLFDGSGLVTPKKADRAARMLEDKLDQPGLFDSLAAIAIPNFSKALQTFAFNQTKANEAQIICALERWRLAHGNYPETLDALVPQFMEKIPHDIIGGQPLHYRRTPDGKFLLYSIGWNETDDNGSPGTLADVKNGDWVWQYPLQ